MGNRRSATRRTEQDELEAANGHRVTTRAEPHPDSLQGRILTWQQSYGNKAVTTAIQRRPQSTDAPGAKKGKKAPPNKGGGPVDYRPSDATVERYRGKDPNVLATEGQNLIDQNTVNQVSLGIERLEVAWAMTKSKDFARRLWLAYKNKSKVKDAPQRAEFWLQVFQGKEPWNAPPPGSKEHA